MRFIQEGRSIPNIFVVDPADLHKVPGLSRDCLELTNLQLGIKLTKDTIEKSRQTSEPAREKVHKPEHSEKAKSSSRVYEPTKNQLEEEPATPRWTDIVKRNKKKKQGNKTITGSIANPAFPVKPPPLQQVCLKITAPSGTTTANISSITKSWTTSISIMKLDLVTSLPSHTAFRLSVQVEKKERKLWQDENI